MGTEPARARARTRTRYSSCAPMVENDPVTKVALDFILRETSPTQNVLCTLPAFPTHGIISRSFPLLWKERPDAWLRVLSCERAQVSSSWKAMG